VFRNLASLLRDKAMAFVLCKNQSLLAVARFLLAVLLCVGVIFAAQVCVFAQNQGMQGGVVKGKRKCKK